MDKSEYRIAVITLSDRCRRGEREDQSGPAILKSLEEDGYKRCEYLLIGDEKDALKRALIDFSEKGFNLILTTGGTGLSERDITPEVTLSVATKRVDGIAEAIRAYSMKKTEHAMLSRGVAVLRDKTLIINFPGSPGACKDAYSVIRGALPHALGIIIGEKLDK